jgi:AraC family transcriptional regulator, ethanolamine operon transcriptional activator
MPRYVFQDFDEFADAIEGVTGRFVPTARSFSDWWMDQARTGRLTLQQVQVGGSAAFAGDGEANCLTLGIPTTYPERIRVDGQDMDANAFLLLRQGRSFTAAAQGATRWSGVTIPTDHEALSPELVESLSAADGPLSHTDVARLEHLRFLIGRMCGGAPGIDLSDATACAAAEQEIAASAARALERSLKVHVRSTRRPHLSRERVIARTLELIEAHEGQPLFTSDLCRAAGVSERTLRNAFSEYFGVGPIRLLKMRQLGEIRAALLAADPARDTVAHVAGRFGVWDFSLFARNYKRLFGESPSETLRRPPGSTYCGRGLSWLRWAVKKFKDDLQDMPRAVGAEQLLQTGSHE